MKKAIFNIVLLANLTAVHGVSQAQDADSANIFTYAKYGTQGIGVGAGYVISDSFTLRGGFNSGSTTSGSRRIDDIRYSYSRKTDHSLEALFDWYPLISRGLRLSGGVYLTDTNNTLTAKQDSAGNFTINKTVYSSDEIGELISTVSTAKVAPYLGVGWDSAKPGNAGLRFISDVGVIHHRGRNVTLTASGNTDNSQLNSDLLAEQGRIKDVNDISLVVSVGVSYSF